MRDTTQVVIDAIAAEREKQIKQWTDERDDDLKGGQLARAAICYASTVTKQMLPGMWPFDGTAWHPEDPRKNLVKAGALIVAEIERLDRAAEKKWDARFETSKVLLEKRNSFRKALVDLNAYVNFSSVMPVNETFEQLVMSDLKGL